MDIKIATMALDYLQRGMALLEKEGYDTSDIQDGVKHLVFDLTQMMIDPIPSIARLEPIKIHIREFSDEFLEECARVRDRDNESVYATGIQI